MSRRNSSGTIAKILQDITWDAGKSALVLFYLINSCDLYEVLVI